MKSNPRILVMLAAATAILTVPLLGHAGLYRQSAPLTISVPTKLGKAFMGSLKLNAKATSNVSITLSSDSSRVSFTKNPVVIKAGKSNIQFNGNVSSGPSGQSVQITATGNGTSVTTTTVTK